MNFHQHISKSQFRAWSFSEKRKWQPSPSILASITGEGDSLDIAIWDAVQMLRPVPKNRTIHEKALEERIVEH